MTITKKEARKQLIKFVGTFECPSVEAVEMAIEALKTDRTHGEWVVEYTDVNGDKWYRCSHCGERFVLIEKGEASTEPYHFCPNCGARMKGADNE